MAKDDEYWKHLKRSGTDAGLQVAINVLTEGAKAIIYETFRPPTKEELKVRKKEEAARKKEEARKIKEWGKEFNLKEKEKQRRLKEKEKERALKEKEKAKRI